MKLRMVRYLRGLAGWFVLILLLPSTTIAQEQPHAPSNSIYLPLVQQQSGGAAESVPSQPPMGADDHEEITAQYKPLTISFVDQLAAADNFACTNTERCRTVLRGVKHVADNGTVRISPGNYPETMVISRSVTLVSTGDMVTIG